MGQCVTVAASTHRIRISYRLAGAFSAMQSSATPTPFPSEPLLVSSTSRSDAAHFSIGRQLPGDNAVGDLRLSAGVFHCHGVGAVRQGDRPGGGIEFCGAGAVDFSASAHVLCAAVCGDGVGGGVGVAAGGIFTVSDFVVGRGSAVRRHPPQLGAAGGVLDISGSVGVDGVAAGDHTERRFASAICRTGAVRCGLCRLGAVGDRVRAGSGGRRAEAAVQAAPSGASTDRMVCRGRVALLSSPQLLWGDAAVVGRIHRLHRGVRWRGRSVDCRCGVARVSDAAAVVGERIAHVGKVDGSALWHKHRTA
eukprot:ctg_528.g255